MKIYDSVLEEYGEVLDLHLDGGGWEVEWPHGMVDILTRIEREEKVKRGGRMVKRYWVAN